MKRFILVKTLLLLLIAPLLTFGQVGYATVNINPNEYLNMRSEASASSEVITKLDDAETLNITGNWDGKWIEVWKGGSYEPSGFDEPIEKGWVHLDFITAPHFTSNILGDAKDFQKIISGMVSVTECAKKTLMIDNFCVLNGELIELEYDGHTGIYSYNNLSIKEILISTENYLQKNGWWIVNYKDKQEFIFIKYYYPGC